MARQLLAAHGERYLRPAASVMAGTPDLPDPERTDAEAAQQREAHLDALIANARQLLGGDWKYVHDYVLTEQLADCRSDLEESGVHFDVWFSEQSLFETGLVAGCVEQLDKAGHLYRRTAPAGSDRLLLATRKIASYSAKMASTPTSRRISPITSTSTSADSSASSMSGVPTITAISRASRVPSPRSGSIPNGSMWRWYSLQCSIARAAKHRCPPVPANS
jgi:hypothetical protein